MPSSPERPRQSRGSCLNAVYVSAALNTALMALQIGMGLFAHSDGVVADGIHTLSDLAADGVVLAVLYLKASAAGSRGSVSADGGVHGTLANLLIGLLLIGTATDMLWHCVGPSTMPAINATLRASALGTALLTMMSKEALFRYMRSEALRNDSAVLHASAWHARLDAMSALVAALGVAGGMAGIPALDNVAAAVIGLMILRMGYSNAWSALRALSVRPLGNTAGP